MMTTTNNNNDDDDDDDDGDNQPLTKKATTASNNQPTTINQLHSIVHDRWPDDGLFLHRRHAMVTTQKTTVFGTCGTRASR
jgi:hypothetical protein